MLKILILCYLLMCLLANIYAEDGEDATHLSKTPIAATGFQEPDSHDVIECIDNFELKATAATNAETEGILSLAETETLQDEMIIALEDIIDLLNANRHNVYVFLKSKGVDRVLIPNLLVDNSEVRTKLLILMKILFNLAPTTTRAVTPVFVVDKLLEIFENDDHLPSKTHSLDVLCLWLPVNPKVQARVMKTKGLDPFYQQISQLDASAIYSLLDLFNKILNEHLKVKNENQQRNRADSETLKIYQRIGLIERISTPTVCNGLLSVFETAWSHSLNNENVIIPVFDLLKKIKPFCMKNISRNMVGRAIELFQSFAKHVKDLKYKEEGMNGFNLTEIETVLQEYIHTLKQAAGKEEL